MDAISKWIEGEPPWRNMIILAKIHGSVYLLKPFSLFGYADPSHSWTELHQISITKSEDIESWAEVFPSGSEIPVKCV